MLDTQQFSTQSTFYERDSFEEEEQHTINKIPVTASYFAKPINVPLGPKQRTDSAQSMNKAANPATSVYPGAASPQGTDTPPSDHTLMNSEAVAEIVAEQQGVSDVTPSGIPVGWATPLRFFAMPLHRRQSTPGVCAMQAGHGATDASLLGMLCIVLSHHGEYIALDPWSRRISVKELFVKQAPHLGP